MNRSSSRTCAMLLAAASIALVSAPALAKDTAKGKWDQDAAYGYCAAKEGSTYWHSPDGTSYGCGYKGGGGLMCDKDTGCLESDGQLDEGQQEEREVPWGWAGLLGLAGLIGLTGRRRRDAHPAR
jgi:hypothetical protein